MNLSTVQIYLLSLYVSFEYTTNSSTLPVPEPYVREPTDFIPDSQDTSATTSREVTQANISQNNGTAEDTKAQQRPKVVSLACRAHEGQLSAAPYSIKPTQLVSLKYLIPGRAAQSVTCLATDASLIADPGVPSSILARSHTFVEIDHEIISTVILLPSAESFKKVCCQLQA